MSELQKNMSFKIVKNVQGAEQDEINSQVDILMGTSELQN